MNYNQFKNISCYEEFEIQCDLTGISKIDVLKKIGHQTNDYYFFVSNDGIFNWFDLSGNHIENSCVLKELKTEHIPQTISECIIPDGVTYIGCYAFYNCNSLKEITIPDSVTCIGNWVFSFCKSLQSITIPNSVTSIGGWVFYGCKSLKEIVIPDSVRYIGEYAFSYCDSLREVIFKGRTLEEVKQMKDYPFGIEDDSIFKCEI